MKWNKLTGKKPTPQVFRQAANYAREGSHAHTVVAMALRPDGLTQQEVITLLGHPHRNKLKQLIKDHKVEQVVTRQPSRIRLISL